MNALEAVKVGAREVEPNHRLGGSIRMLLSPGTARTTAGLMALLELQPGERVSEHYHPYTDEHVYVSEGRLVLAVNGVEQIVDAREAVLIRRGARHGYENRSDRPATAVLFLGPLAPSPDMGHVETAEPAGDGPPPAVDTPPSAAAGAREPA
ncbi:cupin domain-containing protein [Actinomadura luteofluorescens]|uniref:cupin domain-containing protein n=1 Tax=Actinomadura luteofluorescens TaxID=46163 RepID=UPI002164E98A|nr:cupin domain-containing protein [Actinomadura glauciflava]MCR3741320.1 putative monooxygenase [Actinomadura glauciflava]